MLAVAQYVVYALVGAFYYIVMATYLGVAAGFGVMALVLLVLPLLLFGFVSGLSFFYPRIAAALAGTCASPFLYMGVSSILGEADGVEPSVFVIPSAFVVAVSVFALLWTQSSIWARQSRTLGKAILAAFAIIPALLGALLLLYLIVFLSGFRKIS